MARNKDIAIRPQTGRNLPDLFRNMDDLFDRAWRSFGWPFSRGLFPSVSSDAVSSDTWGWAPVVDMVDRGDKLVVRAELPGMKKEDIDISLSGDNLVIKGEQKHEREEKEEDYYLSERVHGRFYRSLALPDEVEAEKIMATYKDGILEVELPKTKEAQQKRRSIPIG